MNQTVDRINKLRTLSKWFISLFLFAGLCILIYGLVQLHMAWRSTGWNTASGSVISSKIVGSGKNKKPEIKYVYTVNDRNYTGDQIYIGPDPMGGGIGIPSPLEFTRKYPEGKPVKIYYDPDDPARSVLEPGINRIIVLLSAMGVFFLLLGTLIRRQMYRGALQVTEPANASEPVDFSASNYQMDFREDQTQDRAHRNQAGRYLALLTLLSFIAVICYAFWPQYHPWLVKHGILKSTQSYPGPAEKKVVSRPSDTAKPDKPALPDPSQAHKQKMEKARKKAEKHRQKKYDLAAARHLADQTESDERVERIHVSISKDFDPIRMHTLGNWRPFTSPLSDKHPERIIREPQYRGSSRKYSSMQLGTGENKTYSFILDLLDDSHPVLYFDKNQNGDFTDDGEPLVNQGSGWFATEVNLPLRRLIKELNTDGLFSIWLFINESSRKKGYANHYSRTKMKGSVLINDRTYLAYIGDRGINDADFTNDGIYIDLDSNGKIERNKEHIKPGQAVRIDGREFIFDINW